MNVRTKCPVCHSENSQPYHFGKEVYPFQCADCGVTYVVSVEPSGPHVETINVKSTRKAMQAQIPEMPNGTPVYVCSRDHPLYLEQGKTKAKKHKHYKVEFISCNKKIHGKCLWMIDDSIDRIPPDMLGDADET